MDGAAEAKNSPLTALEMACLTSQVPASGTPYIDAIITQSLRFKAALSVLEALVSSGPEKPDEDSAFAITYADALLAEFRK